MSFLNKMVAIFKDVRRDVVSAPIAEVLAKFIAYARTLTRMAIKEIVTINSMSVNPHLEREVNLIRYIMSTSPCVRYRFDHLDKWKEEGQHNGADNPAKDND